MQCLISVSMFCHFSLEISKSHSQADIPKTEIQLIQCTMWRSLFSLKWVKGCKLLYVFNEIYYMYLDKVTCNNHNLSNSSEGPDYSHQDLTFSVPLAPVLMTSLTWTL